MAELVDALVSGTSVRKYVQVRVLFWAQKQQEVGLDRPLAPNCYRPGGEIGRHARLRAWCLLQDVLVRVQSWAQKKSESVERKRNTLTLFFPLLSNSHSY